MTTPPDNNGITVIKLGGSTLGAHDTSLRDIADGRRGGRQIVVVHGGGAAVSAWLQRTGVEARFVRGLRVTDAETLEAVVAILAGAVNKQLVAELSQLGAPAIGLSGADSMILQATSYDPELGFVGRIERVNPFPLEELLRLGYLPVVAPIAIECDTREAQLLNTNADTAAGEIAAALHAERLVFLTDVEGVLAKDGKLLARLSPAEANALIASGVAGGGMIPKLEAAARAATAGCATRIIDGTAAAALARLFAGDPLGTTITA
ncbi:MAG: acetylglutamate kinase [Dehalococcoidia bacterium]|nr:MAG: acetylglutamate kinase [Dehalococcoidia bacterium]